MKKALIIALLGLAALAALPSQARADGPMNFYIRIGVITDKNATFDPFLWTAGVNFDFNFTDFLFLSADTDMIVYKFNFKPVWLTPSVMLNLKFAAFYIGTGISKLFMLGSGYTLESDLLFKANAGIKANFFKLQVFAYSPFGNLGVFGIGANIGFGF